MTSSSQSSKRSRQEANFSPFLLQSLPFRPKTGKTFAEAFDTLIRDIVLIPTQNSRVQPYYIVHLYNGSRLVSTPQTCSCLQVASGHFGVKYLTQLDPAYYTLIKQLYLERMVRAKQAQQRIYYRRRKNRINEEEEKSCTYTTSGEHIGGSWTSRHVLKKGTLN